MSLATRDLGPVNILMVDDRVENLIALEAILEPLEQRLVRATSGEEALKLVLTNDFAVILLDVQMPGLNGFETAAFVKSREKSRDIPIIFLTAISKEEQYVFEGYSVGAVDYMAKPFQPDILRSKVAVFVDLFVKREQLKRQEQMLHESERREMELRYRAELLESQARLADIVESAMDAILTFDASHRVTLFNAAAEAMFGCSALEALGTPAGRFFAPSLREEHLAAVCASDAGQRTPRVEEMAGVRCDGEAFPVEASISCLEIGGSRTYTVIARDISERKRAEEALRIQAVDLANAMTELTALNRDLQVRQGELQIAMTARNRFYASMSHELRTPINAILGYSTLLLDNIYGPLTEQQTYVIQRTHKAGQHLLELVNDVLDLSKIEAGKLELQLQSVSIPALIEDLFVTVRPMADEHGSRLTLRREGPERGIITDPRRVRQILLNLLSNAIKFGRGEPIDVICADGEDGALVIEVIDRGEGIPHDDLDTVFDEFVQLATSKHREGTGLGLPISRRLALLLQGRIEVTSEHDVGSTFRLVLPQSAVEDGNGAAMARPLPPAGAAQALSDARRSEQRVPAQS